MKNEQDDVENKKPESNLKVMYTSARQDWATPPAFMQFLRRRWGVEFDLDVAATALTAKAPDFFTVEQDALLQNWYGKCWMNPPFGRELVNFLIHAIDELARDDGAEEVWILVPARTETKWFHDLVMPHASNVYLIRGRLCFIAGEGKVAAEGANSPFPSALIVMDRDSVRAHQSGRAPHQQAHISTIDVPRISRGFKTEENGRQPTLGDF